MSGIDVRTESDILASELYLEWRFLFQDAYGIYLFQIPCQDCGEKAYIAHHTDYQFPLLLTWLCQSCHWHRHWRIVRGEETLLHANPQEEQEYEYEESLIQL